MLLQTEESILKTETPQQNYEWPENYFAETDPVKRRQILDARAGKEDSYLEQLEKLFQARYEQDKSGKYADIFLRSFLELKMTALDLDAAFSEKKNRRAVGRALKNLCLTETEGLSREILYREMCQLTALYIVLCAGDKNYTSVLWGVGKKSNAKIIEKIDLDLRRVGEALPEYLKLGEEFRILQNAILDTKKKYL